MILTYEDYLPTPGSLNFEEMLSLHKEIKQEAGHDGDALDLYKDLLTAAADYSQVRSRWLLWSRDKKLSEDSARTSSHNRVIDCFNILAKERIMCYDSYIAMRGGCVYGYSKKNNGTS